MIRHTALLLITVAAMALPAVAADNAGFALTVLVSDIPRAEYPRGDTVYIEALKGRDYSLRLTNPTPFRVAVALSVDGLNTIDARHTDARAASKWVLQPYETTVISGWQVSDSAARSFFFTNEPNSYAARRGDLRNAGVIEAVFYRERRREVGLFEQITPPNAAGAPAPRAAAKSAAAEDYAATGMGDRQRHDVERVAVDLEDQPAARIRIRYEFRPQLVRLGILPDIVPPLDRRERARGFSSYCPE